MRDFLCRACHVNADEHVTRSDGPKPGKYDPTFDILVMQWCTAYGSQATQPSSTLPITTHQRPTIAWGMDKEHYHRDELDKILAISEGEMTIMMTG
jgi:hypothetical protein